MSDAPVPSPDGRPAGEPYDWYQRARELHEAGDAGAAAELFEHALAAARDGGVGVTSVLESAARAWFDAGRPDLAVERFREVVAERPDDDYGHFGLGMALWRTMQLGEAAEHLAMAAAMNPNRPEFGRALGQVRATVRARRDAGLPSDGPLSPADVPEASA